MGPVPIAFFKGSLNQKDCLLSIRFRGAGLACPSLFFIAAVGGGTHAMIKSPLRF
jgi:hypothetical protein